MTLHELIEKLQELAQGPDGNCIEVVYGQSQQLREAFVKRDKHGPRVVIR